MRLIPVLCAVVWCAAACQPAPAATALQVTLPPTQAAVALATAVPTTAVPTFTPTHTQTPTPTLSATPTLTSTPTASHTLTPTQTLTPSITPTLAPFDFYAFRRPFNRDQIDYADRTYPFGMGEIRGLPVHHGLDFANGRGTGILAIGSGTVYYAGQDNQVLFGPIPNYYGNLVVIEHDVRSPDGQPVYSLYGHMQRIDVTAGQRVNSGERIGSVGDSGVAFGPHLHLEIRVGDPQSFGAVRNPDLWLIPYPDYGTLAGYMRYDDGTPVYEGVISVRRAGLSNAVVRYAYSYNQAETLQSDPLWRENFTLGDLPADTYEVFVSDRNGRVRFRQTVTIEAGKTSFVEVIVPR
jgi:murein DD-endopeptidase MepM/ murein hydrolase activator NlpD